MACDALTLATTLGITGLNRLSERGIFLVLAGVYGATLTAQQAVNLAAANHFSALSDRQIDQILLGLICTGASACTPPPAPSISGNIPDSTSITIQVNGDPVASAVNFIIRYGTVHGGPYPGIQNYPTPINNKLTVTGLTPSTTYYFVAQWDNGAGCVSAYSAETSQSTTP